MRTSGRATEARAHDGSPLGHWTQFERNLRLARPRKPDWDVMTNTKLIQRILSHKDWTRIEYSHLSCVNAAWRSVCQNNLFSAPTPMCARRVPATSKGSHCVSSADRLSEVFLFDKEGTEALFDFLKDKPHLASIPKTINMTYKVRTSLGSSQA